MEVFATYPFLPNRPGQDIAIFQMIGDYNNPNYIVNPPVNRMTQPFLGYKYLAPEVKRNYGIEIYPEQIYDYSSGQYYTSDCPPLPTYVPDPYRTEFVDQPLVKYEYQEPEENFISIDELQYKPSLLKMILPDKRELERKEQERTDLAARKEQLRKEQARKTTESAIEPTLKDSIKREILEKNAPTKSLPIEQSPSPPPIAIKKEVQIKEEDEEEEAADKGIKKEMNDDDYSDDDDVILLDDGDDDEIDENEVGEELNWMDLEEQEKQDFECFLCNKKVASSYNLRRHMMIHTGDRPYGCDICFKRFREFSDLKKHRRTHRTDKNFKCMACHKNIPSDTNATKCTECEQHDRKKTLPYGKFNLEEVPILEGSDKKAFVCPECDRIFGSRHNLRRHFMIHTGEKPYQCDVCEKPFREVSTLKKHMLTHSRIKLFRCFVCDKEYNDYQAYVKHKNAHGGDYAQYEKQRILENGTAAGSGNNSRDSDDENYLFECSECRKRFLDVGLYKAHLKVHSYEFSFQCYICKKMFKKREKLNSHIVTHSYEISDDSD